MCIPIPIPADNTKPKYFHCDVWKTKNNPLITLEVRHGKIYEGKEACNHRANLEENAVIKLWGDKEKLEFKNTRLINKTYLK